ncbi:F0F1 ATP synthase subunit A [Bacillota bacterium LX-D]|nr:F0F1 ATP synthase subunit A [Bacillota bacterium LX-D]
MHEEIGTHSIIHLGGVPLHFDTLLSSWIVIGIILVLSILIRRNIKVIPGKLQVAMETIVSYLGGVADENLGTESKKYMPLILGLFLYIFIANQLGLLPTLGYIKSPTSDLNTTLGLALMVIILVQIVAIRKKGLGKYLKHFIEPYVFFLPINIIEEVAKPITLAFRLFGNIVAGEIVIVVLGMLAPYIIPSAWLLFSVFVGLIQAFIFTMLTISYLSNVLGDEH